MGPHIKKRIGSSARALGTFLMLVIAMAAIGYLGGFFARASAFQMATGNYTGNGTSQSITDVGFQPDLVIIKSDTAVGIAMWKSSAMGNISLQMVYGGAGGYTDAITSLDSDGFSLGTHAYVNNSGVRYTWVAFGGSGSSGFKVGSYTGNGNDDRSVTGVGFQPDLVWIQDPAWMTIWRSSAMGASISETFGNYLQFTDSIQALESDGFQVGTSFANANGTTHYYVAFKAASGIMAVNSYSGNGSDDRSITGAGFQPSLVWVKIANNYETGTMRNDQLSGDESHIFAEAANAVDHIQAFESSGFQVGTNLRVNSAATTYFWAAWAKVPAPTLNSLNPTSGREEDSITLSGSNFGATQGSSSVSFNGTAVTTYTSWSDTEIVVEVPTGATTGNVTVTTDDGTSNGVSFSVYPKITDLSPSSGNIGNTVTITGLNFEASQGSNTVAFNGVAVSSYTSWSATQIVVIAPSSTTGNVIVTTTVGASAGSTFSFYPAISSLSPASTSSRASITINGSNFGDTQGSSYVSSSSVQVTSYLLWGSTSIIVDIPSEIGKGEIPVTVTTNIGTSNSVTLTLSSGATSPIAAILKPSLISITPSKLDISEIKGTIFVITGKSFDPRGGINAQLYLTGTGWFDLTIEAADSTTIKARLVELSKVVTGKHHLVVTNVNGGNKVTLEKALTITDKTALVKAPKEGKTTGAPTTPSTVDSAAIALITKRLDQIMDLLKSFSQVLSSLGATSALGSTYRYEIDFQSPDLSLEANAVGTVTVSVKNTGMATWYNNGVYPLNLGTSNPLDRESIFATDSWSGDNNRPAVLKEGSVAPNSLGTFVVPLKAPGVPGIYLEPFKLVAENLVWLSGPEINWTITVR